jgi:hypothetical protein
VLRDAGYLAMGGQIVDATVVQARRPRLTTDEKATVKGGGVPAGWSSAKRAQMDTDGRGTIKRGRRRPPRLGETRELVTTAIAVPVSGYKTTLGSTAGTASSGASLSPTPRARSGPMSRTARRPTSRCWRAAGWCRSSSDQSRGAGRCGRT